MSLKFSENIFSLRGVNKTIIDSILKYSSWVWPWLRGCLQRHLCDCDMQPGTQTECSFIYLLPNNMIHNPISNLFDYVKNVISSDTNVER